MRRLAAAALAAGLAGLLAGCGGGGPSAPKVLDQTAARLGDIRSGTLHVELSLVPHVRGGERLGFSLDGPFALGGGGLPRSSIAYTQRLGSRSATVRVVSDGRHGYVVVGGKAYRLAPAQAAQLRLATGGLARGALSSLPLRAWVVDPRLTSSGGAYRVTGKLDAVRALNGLFRLTQGLSASVPSVSRADAERVERGVRSSSFELVSGKHDRYLRRLRLDASFGGNAPPALRRALGRLVGVDLRFELSVSRPNEPVHVSAPAHALPASDLPRG